MTALDTLPVETHTDHRIQLEAVYWCFVGISTVFIALRICYGARASKQILGVDDWFMVACWLCFIASGVPLTLIAESGGTGNEAAFTISESEYHMKLQTINLVFWKAASLFGKMAIGFTILRILERAPRWQRWPVYTVIYLMSITCVLDTLLILFRCGDPRNLWNTREQSACLGDGMVYSFNVFAAAWQVFVDFFLAFFPMYIIWTLHIAPSRRKYTIMALLGLTTITGVAASVKTAVSQKSVSKMEDRETAWDIYVLSMWTATEIMLLIVCGSVPIMVPVWGKLVKSCRQGYGCASGVMSGVGHSKSVWPAKEAEAPQKKQSVDIADLEDLEEAQLVRVRPKAIADLPSISHTSESLRYVFASKQGIVDRLSLEWHLREKKWGKMEDEGDSDRQHGDFVV